MNREELEKLTIRERNERVARACGWVCKDGLCWTHPEYGFYQDVLGDIPNFYYDLNEMAEARKTLDSEQIFAFTEHLQEITQAGYLDDPREAFVLLDSKAEQQADAFLLTVG